MTARRYTVAGRQFTKVASAGGKVHVVEEGQFWQGDRAWLHRTVAGESISGTPVSLQQVSCKRCRAEIERLQRSD